MLEADFLARDRWSREELLAFQRERVRAMITHAVTHSPYYREVLGPDAAERPLAELPTLPKPTLMSEFDRVITDPRLRLADLRAHLAGPDPSQSFLGAYRVATTSGTTGRRSIIAFTHDEAAAWRAASVRPMIRLGIGMGSRFAALGSPSPVHVTRQVLVPPGVPAPTISAATPISELVRALNTQQPEVLVGAAGVWRALTEEQRDGRLKIAPRAAHFSSEPLSADLRRRVREAWGIEATSGYAATEAPTIATSSPDHPELEVAEDVVVIEIVDDAGLPVPPGRPGAKVLLTNLINYAQPLIRYELSDSVVESSSPNPAGRPWRCLLSVDGLLPTSCTSQARTARRLLSILQSSGRQSRPSSRWGSTHSYATRAGCTLRSCSLPELRPTSQTSCAAHWLLPSPRLVPYRLWLTSSQSMPCNASPAARSVWFDRFDQDH
jgi:phenylacetate-CoA ligase